MKQDDGVLLSEWKRYHVFNVEFIAWSLNMGVEAAELCRELSLPWKKRYASGPARLSQRKSSWFGFIVTQWRVFETSYIKVLWWGNELDLDCGMSEINITGAHRCQVGDQSMYTATWDPLHTGAPSEHWRDFRGVSLYDRRDAAGATAAVSMIDDICQSSIVLELSGKRICDRYSSCSCSSFPDKPPR